ncbi:hypothetical protein GPX89_30250 [Nocardia sp. ET3-3]|uniref:Uncharacterized protein n=1 Tax=Nocardia terrae TaxID=2675851 RepID=A0A7K1V4Z2_9NOCA|nr:hypothetical protein [Nocardia terrae]MVU81509.1 hypothetical protein [Nocardia terrae]
MTRLDITGDAGRHGSDGPWLIAAGGRPVPSVPAAAPETPASPGTSPGRGVRMLDLLEAVVHLGGPLWFERPLITQLSVLRG